jgi:hypothetical protein
VVFHYSSTVPSQTRFNNCIDLFDVLISRLIIRAFVQNTRVNVRVKFALMCVRRLFRVAHSTSLTSQPVLVPIARFNET